MSTTSSPQQQVLQSAPSPVALRKRPVADDTDGHLAYLPGDILGDRYEIISTLGEYIPTVIKENIYPRSKETVIKLVILKKAFWECKT